MSSQSNRMATTATGKELFEEGILGQKLILLEYRNAPMSKGLGLSEKRLMGHRTKISLSMSNELLQPKTIPPRTSEQTCIHNYIHC